MSRTTHSEIAVLRTENERLRSLLQHAGIDAEAARLSAKEAAGSAQTRHAVEIRAQQDRSDGLESHNDELVRLNRELSDMSLALAASESRYKAIIESATDYAIMALDLEGRVTTWNEGARRTMGWTEAEMLGQPGALIFVPEDREARQPELEMELSLRFGRAEDERWHIRKDGSRFWANGLMMPLRKDGAGIQGYLKILRDRTQERDAAERERRTAERLRLALSASVMVGIWDWDLETDLIHSDANFARLYGVDPDRAALGAPLSEYIRTLHPEDLPALQDGIARTLGRGAPFSLEYRLVQADRSIRWVLARGSVVHDESGRPVRFSGATVDITDRKRAEERQAALVELGDRFRDIEDPAAMAFVSAEVLGRTLETTRAGYGTVDPTGEYLEVAPDWRREGMSSVAGTHRFSDFGTFVEDLRQGEIVAIDDVRLDPRTASNVARLEQVNIRALLNVPVIERGRLVAVLLLHDCDVRHWAPDKVAFIRDVAQRTRDAVERRRSEDHQRLLLNELQHRVKNTLTMIQAIAGQTFRATESAAARDAFTGRVVALSQANDMLTRAGWTAAAMREVVTGATIPHCATAERFTISGPALEIAARAALSLTLALHELCTNAAKYGALSNEHGHVTIHWEVADDATFKLRWAESGGPAVAKPDRTGFGTRLIQRSLGPQLGGEIHTDYDPSGLTCTFELPLASVQDGPDAS